LRGREGQGGRKDDLKWEFLREDSLHQEEINEEPMIV
jgi:hypothetical protein